MDDLRNMDECIDVCTDCAQLCTATLYDCLEAGGELAKRELIGMLSNCALLCETSAQFMLSGSPLHVITCSACAQVCDRVAEALEAHGDSLADCAEACRDCADTCREMSGIDRGLIRDFSVKKTPPDASAKPFR